MSINKLISIKSPIIDALDFVGTDRAKDMPVFMTWAIEAEKEIGHSSHVLKRHKKVIDIHGCKAELPCNAEVLEWAVLGAQNCDCNDLRDSFSAGLPPGNIDTSGSSAFLDGTGFLVIDVGGFNNQSCNYLNYEIQDNCIIFHHQPGNSVLTIQYLGLSLDEQGFPKISENHTRAIRQYLLLQYMIRSKFSSNPFSRDDIQIAEAKWARLVRHARADDAALSPSETEEMGNLLSNNPYAGKGLTLGMRTNNWYNYM